ncbi:MAG TPA: GNAT family N-acetyltransferase [Candidatus Acidoferrales bacterium]|nr:GNAT family N-acetyltransferase [Candidatus Acidoferrales bacterium]
MHRRAAVESDLPAIVEIYNAAIPGRMATADTEPVSVESRHVWFREHAPGSRPLWVMESAGAIVGWLSFQSFYGRPAYHATAEISVYVSPAQQRHGTGRQLLQEAIRRGPALGLTTLVGYIFAHNIPSLTLFEGCDFRRWGHLPRIAELDGVERDLVIVGRRLEVQKGREPAPIIRGVHHAQITVARGAEAQAREFYCTLLGLSEVQKPAALQDRGGFWLQVGDRQVHVGIEDGVDRQASKAHVAYAVSDLAGWRARLQAHGIVIQDGIPIPGLARFEFRDPFGNRIEFIEPPA